MNDLGQADQPRGASPPFSTVGKFVGCIPAIPFAHCHCTASWAAALLRTSRPDLLKQQWPAMEPLVDAFGYSNVRVEGFEAKSVGTPEELEAASAALVS